MFSIFRGILLLTITALLASCGEVKRINPPVASIQQLKVNSNGPWQLDLRIQNFSSVAMHYAALNAQLNVMDIPAGTIDASLNLDIPGESADVTTISFIPSLAAQHLLDSAKTQTQGEIGIVYLLKGSIRLSEPKSEYPFEYKSTLTPVPGLSNVYR